MTKKLTNEEFINRVSEIHGDSCDYTNTKYVNMKTKVSVFCRNHNTYFEVSPVKHLAGQKCRECFKQGQRDAKTVTTEMFIKKAKAVHGDKYDYSRVQYVNSQVKVEIGCSHHGFWFATPNNHISKSNFTGCPACGNAEISKSKTKDTAWFIEKAKSIHGDKYDYSQTEYTGCFSELIVSCKQHGAFSQFPYQHFNNTHACPTCSPSVSRKETEWLDYMNIPQSCRQHWIRVGGKTWSVDAIDYHTKTVYEFYGDFWHGNPNRFDSDKKNPYAGVTYGELYERTLAREQVFVNEGYKFITIWECEWDEIKKSITK